MFPSRRWHIDTLSKSCKSHIVQENKVSVKEDLHWLAYSLQRNFKETLCGQYSGSVLTQWLRIDGPLIENM